MVNIANIDRLIEHLKTQTEIGFNMSTFLSVTDSYFVDRGPHNCGTTACLAGHIMILTEPPETLMELQSHKRERWSDYDFISMGAEFLDLTFFQADELFMYGQIPSTCVRREVSLDQAITTLEHLRDTGEVNWPKTLGLLP